MAYAGLGSSISASVALAPPPPKRSSSSSSSLCVTKKQQDAAKLLCRTFRWQCATAEKPICGEALPMISAPVVNAPTAFVVSRPPPATPGVQHTAAVSSRSGGAYNKLPVPVAAPAPPLPVAPPPPAEEGVPTWVWIAGGALVLGTGAFLYSRKKGS